MMVQKVLSKKTERSRRRRMNLVVFWCIIVLSLVHVSLAAQTSNLKWEVEYMYGSPDCLEHVVMGINKEFPGPTIRAKAGDTLVIEVTNKLHTEGLVIHWHGIRQIGTPWADGTASISQCAINPGETFTYNFTVDRPGTYYYHGHYGMQRSAGLYGSLIVDLPDGEKEPFQYDGEFNMLLSDWWHEGVHDQEVGLSSSPFRWIGEPQSILINGRGQYNCSMASKFSNNTKQCEFKGDEPCAPQFLKVEPNKTYRLRIASTTALASLNLAIEGHEMEVVEADGHNVEPFSVKDMDIYSGESYSVLIKADQNPLRNYWISIGVRGRDPKTPQALTVLNYSLTPASNLPSTQPPITPQWNDYNHSKTFTKSIYALKGSPQPPKTFDRRINLLNTQNTHSGTLKWSLNNVSLVLPSTPYLGSIKFGLTNGFDQKSPPDDYDRSYDVMKPALSTGTTQGSGVYNITLNTTIDVILQNANALAKDVSEIHPWHLHGHDFWILGYGEGQFKDGDDKTFNLENPPLRNTAVVFPFGWTALRFFADNPGVWAFHCHIEPHLHMGMGVIFAEAVDRVGKIPKEALACGLTAKMLE